MLTRLKVSGFKNLVDVDVRFGPFTCIAGANGAGKSNLFDAIQFLSALADRPLIDAALSVRDEGGRTGDIRSLFHCVGTTYADIMTFIAEMIVPSEGIDELGQQAKASITFLRYAVTLAYRTDESLHSMGSLELIKEELSHINLGDATNHLLFPHTPLWRKSVLRGRRTSPLISTETEPDQRIKIKVHQDGSGGRPLVRLAANLPRTMLSASDAAESPTALLARREMQSWRLLHLEPSCLRQPDNFKSPTHLAMDGSHIAATLYHLAHRHPQRPLPRDTGEEWSARVYADMAHRLAELLDDVHQIRVDRDDQRELLTLYVAGRDGTQHPARALSDGTLRFLALLVFERDPEARGLLCLEEPENGIYPGRIPAMLTLLQDIATDVNEAVGVDNPLRQVIINTHAPAVVGQVPDDSLLVAELRESGQAGRYYRRAGFSCLPETWRTKSPEGAPIISKGKLLAYLNPIAPVVEEPAEVSSSHERRHALPPPCRVIDRADLQLFLFGE